MNIGVSTSSLYPLETELALERIGKAGVKNAEVFFNCEGELKPAFIDMLCDIRDEYGINITSVHPTNSLAESFLLFSEYDRRFYEGIDKFARYSEIAAELGAKYIIMHGGKNNGILSDEEYCERYMQLNAETLKNGIYVLQENVANFRARDREFLRSMCDILGDNAKFCFDVKQAVRSGYDPLDLAEEFAPHIMHCHISDHSVSSDCLLPFNGGFDFNSFFDLMSKSNYNGAFIIEVYKNAYRSYNEIYASYNKFSNNKI
ncbi:MAG: sugar phosphate isomerase/epimerase [Clostridia bacterium]|nr:sugar phosphate isomerase/epimerase [Clostridia bacterium]